METIKDTKEEAMTFVNKSVQFMKLCSRPDRAGISLEFPFDLGLFDEIRVL